MRSPDCSHEMQNLEVGHRGQWHSSAKSLEQDVAIAERRGPEIMTPGRRLWLLPADTIGGGGQQKELATHSHMLRVLIAGVFAQLVLQYQLLNSKWLWLLVVGLLCWEESLGCRRLLVLMDERPWTF